MTRRVALALAFVAPALFAGVALVPGDATAQSAPSCIRSRGEVRYGASAYNHIVVISNACAVVADCVVTTDVNPDPQKVSVEPKREVEVVTFLGLPAREFKPNVSCALRHR